MKTILDTARCNNSCQRILGKPTITEAVGILQCRNACHKRAEAKIKVKNTIAFLEANGVEHNIETIEMLKATLKE